MYTVFVCIQININTYTLITRVLLKPEADIVDGAAPNCALSYSPHVLEGDEKLKYDGVWPRPKQAGRLLVRVNSASDAMLGAPVVECFAG